MSKKISEPSDLFDDEGILIQDGWTTKPILKYNRDKALAKWYRLKEWDNYVINHPKYNFSITVADVGYLGMISFEIVDYETQKVYSDGLQEFFTKGRWSLPTSSKEGDIEFHNDKFDLVISKLVDKRDIKFEFPSFYEKGLKGELILYQDPAKDSIVKVNRYENKKLFYYSDKIVWMPVEGRVKFGDKNYIFDTKSSHARLDWGRGAWPYKINWYWGAAAGKTKDGHEIWFSHGHSYEDPTFHDKNMVGYDGKGHKLGPIRFHIPDNPMDPWKFTSEDGRFSLTMIPLMHNPSKMNFIIFNSKSNLVYGLYTGDVVLDDGSKIHVENILGHAEAIKWKW